MTAIDAVRELQQRMAASIIGQQKRVERLLFGLAKTRAIESLAKNRDAKLSRIQFTPDLLPADIAGSDMYRRRQGRGEGGVLRFIADQVKSCLPARSRPAGRWGRRCCVAALVRRTQR